jgi:predicted HTH domain antitoxin
MSQVQIPIDIEEDVSKLLGDSLEEVKRHALEMIVLELYRRRELSAGRAAKLLGLDRFAFIRWAGSLGIPYLDMTREEWEQELRVINKA